jgi:hypothetical protein
MISQAAIISSTIDIGAGSTSFQKRLLPSTVAALSDIAISHAHLLSGE